AQTAQPMSALHPQFPPCNGSPGWVGRLPSPALGRSGEGFAIHPRFSGWPGSRPWEAAVPPVLATSVPCGRKRTSRAFPLQGIIRQCRRRRIMKKLNKDVKVRVNWLIRSTRGVNHGGTETQRKNSSHCLLCVSCLCVSFRRLGLHLLPVG